MKIVHMTSVHKPDDIRIFKKECVSLAKAGHNVILIALAGEDGEESIDGVRVVKLWRKTRNRIIRALRGSKSVYKRALAENADIYHLHDPELLKYGVKLAKKGKKVIYDAHENLREQTLYRYWIPKLMRKPLSVLVDKYEKKRVSKLWGFITVNKSIFNELRRVNANGIICSNYALPDFTSKYERYKSIIDNNFCFLGYLTQERGVGELVEAAEKTGLQLRLIGTFSPEAYKNILQKHPGWKNTTHYGYMTPEEYKPILENSLAGMLTYYPVGNYIDASPNKLFEYMALGLPVIASNFPEWIKIVEGNDAGICVDPKDSQAISDALLKIKDKPELAVRMGKNAKRAFLKKYNWGVEEKKLLEFYEKAIHYNNKY